MEIVKQVAKDSNVSKELDASDDTNTDVLNILSPSSAPSDSLLFAISAEDGLPEGVIESERETNSLLCVSTAELGHDVNQKLPEDSSKMLLSEDTSPTENIKC